MSRELAISRPNALAWMNLPKLDVPQYLMTIAQFDELGEYLRSVTAPTPNTDSCGLTSLNADPNQLPGVWRPQAKEPPQAPR